MSVELNPAISHLDTHSLCYKIYIHLYNSFFNAQDQKSDSHPWGVVEGDEVSIRLHNTAYNFAEAISGGITGEAGSEDGGILLDYLKKSGGDMSGMLRANYGLEAGTANHRILETYQDSREGVTSYGLRVYGNLEIGGNGLLLSGENVLSYAKASQTTTLSGKYIHFGTSSLESTGNFLIGENKEKGVYLSADQLSIHGQTVYHGGNANSQQIDWTMKDAIIHGCLSVQGEAVLSGNLSSLYGFKLGSGGKTALRIDKNCIVHLDTNLSFTTGCGIKVGEAPVLVRANATDIQLGAINGDVLLGSGYTHKLRLLTDLFDVDGDYALLSKYGAAYLPDGLVVRHNYGDELLSSYRRDSFDEGMIIHKRMRFGSGHEGFLYGKEYGLVFASCVIRNIVGEAPVTYNHETRFVYSASSSKLQPLNRLSNSLYIETDADFITLNKPVEGKEYIGIDGSYTRLMDRQLFFDSESCLLAINGGIKHVGDALFTANLSSEKFSSGFAGSGWAIFNNKTTGNVAATFDELTIRKKMRIYELEVQKLSATNGSLWVSDHCSGDSVQKLN